MTTRVLISVASPNHKAVRVRVLSGRPQPADDPPEGEMLEVTEVSTKVVDHGQCLDALVHGSQWLVLEEIERPVEVTEAKA